MYSFNFLTVLVNVWRETKTSYEILELSIIIYISLISHTNAAFLVGIEESLWAL